MESVDLEVLRTSARWLDEGRRALLVTVVRTWGSSPRPEGAMLAVRDDGEGIDVEPLDRIFEPFYSNRSGAPGTGLGLAIVAGAALAHRGQIAVATDRGAGSCFRLTLPAAWGTGPPRPLAARAPGAEEERT